MAPARFFWRFASDYATAVATSEGYQREAANLQTASLAEVWQTGATLTEEAVVVDLGAATAVGAFALLAHDLDGTETGLTLEANTADSWGTPAFSRAVTHRADHLVEFFAPETYRYWRFVFTKALAADQRQAGRLVLGPYYECPRNVRKSTFKWGWRDLSKVARTRGGVAHADVGARLRTLKAGFYRAPEVQAQELDALGETNGTHTPFLISVDHDAYPTQWLLYGLATRLAGRSFGSWHEGTPRWDLALEMEAAK